MQTIIMSLQQQFQNGSNQNQDPQRRQRGRKYCWAYGACNQSSPYCKSKAQNHVDSATFNNRQGGRNKGCKEWRWGTEVKSQNINSNKLFVSNLTSVVPPNQITKTISTPIGIAKADSGAIAVFWRLTIFYFMWRTGHPISTVVRYDRISIGIPCSSELSDSFI